MTEYVTLLCPPGAFDYPAADGVETFHPYRLDLDSRDMRDAGGPWAVKVPSHVAPHFTHNAGFALMSETHQQPPQPVGTVRMRHREGLRDGVSWRGDHYPADAEGVVNVPHAAVVELMGHQMEPVPEEGTAKIDQALDQLHEGVAAEGQRVEELKHEAQAEMQEHKHEGATETQQTRSTEEAGPTKETQTSKPTRR